MTPIMKRILIVEDDPDMRLLLQIVLSRAGFEVWEAEDAEHALTMLHQNKAPDLIILDLLLPHVNGLALCESIRQHKPTAYTPILIVSAQGDASTLRSSMEAGATDYIRKPILPTMVLAKVQQLLALEDEVKPALNAED
ncbi:MAG TPA: response regulator [Aggregatilineales bacterium]|nr:response regulator [Aggregatilineales bacterium]